MNPTFAVLFFGPSYGNTIAAVEKPVTVTKVAQARFFRTNVAQEYSFLSFMDALYQLETSNRSEFPKDTSPSKLLHT